MKKLFLFISILSVILISCGPQADDAIKYNDSLIDITDKIIEQHALFIHQLDGHNVDSLRITHQLFVNQSKTGIEEFSKIKKFDEKNEFGNSVSEFIVTLNSTANNEAKEMVELLSKDSEQYTDYDQQKLEMLVSKFDEKNEKAFKNLKKEQLAFSKEWNLQLNFDK